MGFVPYANLDDIAYNKEVFEVVLKVGYRKE